METYKKGDYIAIITNEPMVHFIEMFGDGLDTDDVEEQKYIARIKNVIDAGNYFVYIPSAGYRCIINSSEILRKVSEEELTDDDKDDEPQFDPVPDGPAAYLRDVRADLRAFAACAYVLCGRNAHAAVY